MLRSLTRISLILKSDGILGNHNASNIHYFIFDLLVWKDRDLTRACPCRDRLAACHERSRHGSSRVGSSGSFRYVAAQDSARSAEEKSLQAGHAASAAMRGHEIAADRAIHSLRDGRGCARPEKYADPDSSR